MKRFPKLASIAALSFASVVFTATAADMMSDAAAEALMKANGGAVGALAKIAKGEMPFDAAAAEAAKQALIANAVAIPEAFKLPFEEADAGALPAVWENHEDFIAKASAFGDAAAALDVTSAESIGAGLAAIGAACGGCHQLYKKPA